MLELSEVGRCSGSESDALEAQFQSQLAKDTLIFNFFALALRLFLLGTITFLNFFDVPYVRLQHIFVGRFMVASFMFHSFAASFQAKYCYQKQFAAPSVSHFSLASPWSAFWRASRYVGLLLGARGAVVGVLLMDTVLMGLLNPESEHMNEANGEVKAAESTVGCVVTRDGFVMLVTFLFAVLLFYYIFFLLSLRQSLTVGPLCVFLYALVVCGTTGTPVRSDLWPTALRLDFWVLSGVLLIVLVAKNLLETTQRRLFVELREPIVDGNTEKVKSALYLLEGGGVPSDGCRESHWVEMREGVPLLPDEAPLAASPRPATSSGSSSCGRSGGDCLPSDAVVWLEGASRPQALGEVGIGHKVLCLDTLTKSLRYVDVTKASISMDDPTRPAIDWLIVTLEDGTQLEMTADHPLIPRNLNERPQQAGQPTPVRAVDLVPSMHCLPVLRVVHVPVSSVTRRLQQQPRAAVSLSVRQPERNLIFAAHNRGIGPDFGSSSPFLQTMSVGSADLHAPAGPPPAPGCGPGWEVPIGQFVKNTFLSFPDESRSDTSSRCSMMEPAPQERQIMRPVRGRTTERRLPRSNSAPPTANRRLAMEFAVAAQEPSGLHNGLSGFSGGYMSRDQSYNYSRDYGFSATPSGTLSLRTVDPNMPMFLHLQDASANPGHVQNVHNQTTGSQHSWSEDSQSMQAPVYPYSVEPVSQFSEDHPSTWRSSEHSMGREPAADGDDGSRKVQVGANMTLQRGSGGTPLIMQTDGRQASLQDLVLLKEIGLSSLGALAHESGDCRPCKFNNWNQQPCWKGALCERCHDDQHTDKVARRVRRGGAKKKPALIQAMMASTRGDGPQQPPQQQQQYGAEMGSNSMGTKRLHVTAL